MKDFIVNDGKKEFTFRLPTKITEITSDYLKAVTDDIVIAPYYAVVASIYRVKLPEVISTNKKSRSMAISIVPVFVKANLDGVVEEGTKQLFEQINPADRIIIAGSNIERGYQLSTPKNLITMDTVVKIYNNDNKFAKEVMIDQNYYFFADFKLVSITDIKGKYNINNSSDFVNPFVTINSKELGN